MDQALQAQAMALESAQRKAFMDALGPLGEQYRERVYAGFSGERSVVGTADLSAFIDLALEFIDDSIAANRLSYLFDLRGPSSAVDTACSSSRPCR